MIHTVGNDSKYMKFKILLNLYLGKCVMESGRVFGLKSDLIRPNHGAQFWEARADRFSTLAWPGVPVRPLHGRLPLRVNSALQFMASSTCRPGVSGGALWCVGWTSCRH